MNIVIIDQHSLLACGLKSLLLNACPEAEVGMLSGVEDLVQQLSWKPLPDVLICDNEPPLNKGEYLLRELERNGLKAPVLQLYDSEDLAFLQSELDRGVAGLIHKNSEPGELLRAIEQIKRLGSYINPVLSRRLQHFKELRLNLLSRRQQQVLNQLVQGSSNRDIGGELGISELTVKSHVRALFDVIGASNRVDCVRKAVKLGLVT